MVIQGRELATVLAALRFWQRKAMGGDPELDIATDGETIDALSDAEIDTLCEQLNEAADPEFFATPDEIDRAREQYADDDIQIDDGARASRTHDGLWVEAQVWLSEEFIEDECETDAEQREVHAENCAAGLHSWMHDLSVREGTCDHCGVDTLEFLA